MKYNFAIIEDNQDIRRDISEYFAKSERIDCVLAVDTVEKFLKYHRDFLEIKLILLDVMLYNRSSIYDIAHILQREPEAEIIMFTVIDDSNVVFQALTYGATGYLLKNISMEELERSMLVVLEGKGALLSPAVTKKIINYFWPKSEQTPVMDAHLKKKETVVLNLLKEGRTYDEISQHLGISINGVRYYIKGIYRKLKVNSRGELIRQINNTRDLNDEPEPLH